MHPAKLIPFDELYNGLQEAVKAGLVVERKSDDGLSLYCYTQKCTFDRAWTDITKLARGLILDVPNKKIVALSFPKFFNYGEEHQTLPDLPFEVFEKLDGSLIIIFFHKGKWRCATKGSFNSDQAQWAQKYVDNLKWDSFFEGMTLLAEAIYPENKIVVNYDFQGLVLLAAYDHFGHELPYEELLTVSDVMKLQVVKRQQFTSFLDILEHVKTLTKNEEGFVIRYANGYRIKIKGEEYLRIHRMISHVTPLALWELMLYDKNLDEYRRELPEEFWGDFDRITTILNNRASDITSKVEELYHKYEHLTNKELGQDTSVTKFYKSLLFSYRSVPIQFMKPKLGIYNTIIPCPRNTIFNRIKPSGNQLDGYEPSNVINEVMHGV